MGVPFASSRGTTFSADCGAGDGFLLSVFLRDGDEVYRTYSTAQRGVDRLCRHGLPRRDAESFTQGHDGRLGRRPPHLCQHPLPRHPGEPPPERQRRGQRCRSISPQGLPLQGGCRRARLRRPLRPSDRLLPGAWVPGERGPRGRPDACAQLVYRKFTRHFPAPGRRAGRPARRRTAAAPLRPGDGGRTAGATEPGNRHNARRLERRTSCGCQA